MIFSLAWRDLRASGRSLWVFSACLLLGVSLIAASGGLYQLVRAGILSDTRSLFGGDLEVHSRQPLEPAVLDWIRHRGEHSLLVELRTMLLLDDGQAQLVELQSIDRRYPLYGSLRLAPAGEPALVLGKRDGSWGVAVDPVLAQRLGLGVGSRVALGDLDFEVRAVIAQQPDRSLRADWRGPPVLIAAEALAATGLIQPASRVAYRYRIKTAADPGVWQLDLAAAFPRAEWEIRSFGERSRWLAESLGQIGSGLLLVGMSALFIGGLGVFNSVNAHLQRKLATLATLRALGLRDARLAAVYLWQILLAAAAASLAGTLIGGVLALAGAALAAERLPQASGLAALAPPLAWAWLIGVFTAVTFALPALGRALSISPAALFRGLDGERTRTPGRYWRWTAASALATLGLAMLVVPDPRFALGFGLVVVALLAVLELVVRGLRAGGRWAVEGGRLQGGFALRLALANLYRPGSPLRAALLSLGSAATLVVACTLVVGAVLRMIEDTIPAEAPALVFYDIAADQRERLRDTVAADPGFRRLDLAPLVLGRLSRVNGEVLHASADPARRMEARDEHKLSYRLDNIDGVTIDRGAWWPADYRGRPLVAMEDREADQLGLRVGDRLEFTILGETVSARLVAIYAQRRFQARFWLEAIFSDGVLEPYLSRYVGAAYLDPQRAVALQDRIARAMPNIVTVRTAGLLEQVRNLLGRASAGLAVIAAISLLASLLVLISVVAAGRVRQVYTASLLHALGARVALIRRALHWEFLLLASLTALFAATLGGLIAVALLQHRLRLDTEPDWWLGALAALLVSGLSLTLGARYLLRRLRAVPASLLRAGG